MGILRELFDLMEANKSTKVSKRAAKRVYHRDYVKTKNKPYRKYDHEQYEKSKGE